MFLNVDYDLLLYCVECSIVSFLRLFLRCEFELFRFPIIVVVVVSASSPIPLAGSLKLAAAHADPQEL